MTITYQNLLSLSEVWLLMAIFAGIVLTSYHLLGTFLNRLNPLHKIENIFQAVPTLDVVVEDEVVIGSCSLAAISYLLCQHSHIQLHGRLKLNDKAIDFHSGFSTLDRGKANSYLTLHTWVTLLENNPCIETDVLLNYIEEINQLHTIPTQHI